MINLDSIGLSIVDYCNMKCVNCASFCDVLEFDSKMYIEQISRFVDEAIDLSMEFKHIWLVGGEPTLHPQLSDVFALLEKYVSHYPQCVVELTTNCVKRVEIPGWIRNVNAEKFTNENYFVPVLDNIIENKSCSNGCFVIDFCGFGMTKYGFYPCDIAGKMDALLGWDVGIKSLKDVNESSLEKLLGRFCKHCGWSQFESLREFLSHRKNYGSMISPFWQEVLSKFDGVKLSLYE